MAKGLMWTQFALLIFVLATFLMVFRKNRRTKNEQDKLVDALKGVRYWRINLARENFYQKWLRFMPFEAKGVLIDEGDSLRIKGHWLKEKNAFESRFQKSQCRVEWLGNRSIKAGNLHWAKLITERGTLLFSADTGINAQASREALADIFRSAFPEFALNSEQTSDFALEKNRRSLTLLLIMAGLGVGGIFNQFFASSWLELTDDQLVRILSFPLTLPLALLASFGVAWCLYLHLSKGRVPSRESIVLSMLMSLILLATAIPLAKRIDQILASSPSENQLYRVKKSGVLEPIATDKGLPKLRFPRSRDYWEQFPEGSEYPIPFVHGPLGLWQLDHSQFDPPLLAFYEKQEKAGK